MTIDKLRDFESEKCNVISEQTVILDSRTQRSVCTGKLLGYTINKDRSEATGAITLFESPKLNVKNFDIITIFELNDNSIVKITFSDCNFLCDDKNVDLRSMDEGSYQIWSSKGFEKVSS